MMEPIVTTRDEIERLSKEINKKFAAIAEARKQAGLKPGEPLLGLSFPTDADYPMES